MSGDFISRKALMEDFRNTITENSDTFDWLNMISRQPSAYDVDKVIEKLKTELSLAEKEKGRCARENPLQFDMAKGYAQGISVALEIVKSGGVADD